MKKALLLGFSLFLLMCGPALARQSIFNPLDNSLTIECLRTKQNDQIGSECFKLELSFVPESSFSVQSVAPPSSSAYESSDGTFDLATSNVELPEVLVGLDVFSVGLSYDSASGLLSLTSASHVRTENQNADTAGACNFGGDSIFALTGATVCLAYEENVNASSAAQACTSLGGTWSANSACPANHLTSCFNENPTDNETHIIYYYDAGIVDMYNTSVSIFEMMGGPAYPGPTPVQQLNEGCETLGGVPLF